MSYANLKLTPWTSPTDGSVRVYINSRFCEQRGPQGMWAFADGAYLKADEYGFVTWGASRTDMSGKTGEGCSDIIDNLGLRGVSFAELLRRVSVCQTKCGHFSMRQYDKLQSVMAA